MRKVLVEVTAKHDINSYVRPLSIKWEDDRIFEVDRVLDVRQAPSLKGGGLGVRYTCRIRNKEVYLFDDEGVGLLNASELEKPRLTLIGRAVLFI